MGLSGFGELLGISCNVYTKRNAAAKYQFFGGFRVCKTRFIVVSDFKEMKLCLLQFVLLMN